MTILEHWTITWTALRRWFVAQVLDAAAVGILWLAGLLIIGIPLAPLWAVLGTVFQFIPHLGPVLSLIGPAAAAALTRGGMPMIYVLILYAGIVIVDGLVLQPVIMRRTAKVPIWASVTVPLVLGFFFSFWGLLLAPPLLAIIFSYRERRKRTTADPV